MNTLKYLILLLISVMHSLSIWAFDQVYQVEGLLEQAESFETINNDSACFFANKALRQSQSPDDMLDAINLLVRLNVKNGKYIDALNYADMAKELVADHKILNRDSEIYSNLGVVYRAVGLSSSALEFFLKAISLNEKTQVDESNLKYYLGLVSFDIGDLNQANEYIRQSISIAESGNLEKQLVSSYLSLANTLSNPDSILFYLNQSEVILNRMDIDELIEEQIALNIQFGLIYESIGNISKSKHYTLKARSIAEKMNYQYYNSVSYNNYAYLLMTELKYDSAEFYLKHALKIALEIASQDLEYDIYDSFSDYYNEIGDYENSLLYKARYIDKYKEFIQKQNHQQTQFLTVAFETEKKDKEILIKENKLKLLGIYLLASLFVILIALTVIFLYRHRLRLNQSKLELEQKSKSLEIADAMIEGQDLERKKLAEDLHDGLISYISGLKNYINGSISNQKTRDEIIQVVDTIYTNLRNLSHLKRPSYLEDLGLVFTLKNIIKSINETNSIQINFEYNWDERLSSKLETNLYYLISELINNAVKHSKGDTVIIQITKENNQLFVLVEDNGGNFDRNKLKPGLGLKNIEQRINYLNAKMHSEFSQDSTIFLISVPI